MAELLKLVCLDQPTDFELTQPRKLTIHATLHEELHYLLLCIEIFLEKGQWLHRMYWNLCLGKVLSLSVSHKLFLFQAESTITLHTPVFESNYIFMAMKKGR